ncbi:pectate lyase [Cellvibrio mixtus]|uniref:Pectate lyase n=1 Tax=Cellvibrio mixtus TaxID=39650 RepID=A0A266QDL3_9GAMM|nr:pectate lyase [Cellvibrio mixtus]OZY87459.1 pectate lyase [Cellvibrio mixtus]
MFNNQNSCAAKRSAAVHVKSLVAAMGLVASGSVFAAATGGFSTTDGGNLSGARSFSASTYEQINTIIANAKLDDAGKKVTGGAYPLIITYTGNEDTLINQVIRDHTVDASGNCPKARWNDAYRYVEIKEFTKGITIQGANGSSANFGIVINKSENVIVRNMKIGALAGANNDADMIRIDSGVNVWIDHNELFAVNNECKGSPDGDLTFESALDIKKASQNITVSYNLIRDSKKVGLDGSSSSDIAGGRKITFHHNIYRNVNARLPLQRGGWTHMYNNLYDGITDSGINVRQGGYALIESNWFQNAKNPITCRYDSSNCGFWDLRNNNVRNPGDFAAYNITWSSGGTIDATNWTTTQPFPISIPYSYSPVTPQCVKDRLAQYAGVGKNGAQLTSSVCGGTTSSAASSTPAVSSSSRSSSSVASVAPSSSSAATSSASGAPVLSGTGDYPSGFSKCADLGGTCSVTSGDGWVAFGRKGSWVTKKVTVGGSIACTVAAFGSDPGGNPNKCSYKK